LLHDVKATAETSVAIINLFVIFNN
jgi:hypothetical protein